MDNYIIEEHRIVCNSESGNQYYITKTACSCKGFGFRRNCRHYDYCKNNNLFEELTNKLKNNIDFLSSPYIKNMRILALEQFLIKNNIKFTKDQILKIEPIIRSNTQPNYILNLFLKG